ncbi:MAG: hypothetical protein U0S48_06210 [Solirubrobacteraceae bacterium]
MRDALEWTRRCAWVIPARPLFWTMPSLHGGSTGLPVDGRSMLAQEGQGGVALIGGVQRGERKQAVDQAFRVRGRRPTPSRRTYAPIRRDAAWSTVSAASSACSMPVSAAAAQGGETCAVGRRGRSPRNELVTSTRSWMPTARTVPKPQASSAGQSCCCRRRDGPAVAVPRGRDAEASSASARIADHAGIEADALAARARRCGRSPARAPHARTHWLTGDLAPGEAVDRVAQGAQLDVAPAILLEGRRRRIGRGCQARPRSVGHRIDLAASHPDIGLGRRDPAVSGRTSMVPATIACTLLWADARKCRGEGRIVATVGDDGRVDRRSVGGATCAGWRSRLTSATSRRVRSSVVIKDDAIHEHDVSPVSRPSYDEPAAPRPRPRGDVTSNGGSAWRTPAQAADRWERTASGPHARTAANHRPSAQRGVADGVDAPVGRTSSPDAMRRSMAPARRPAAARSRRDTTPN